MLDFQFWQVFYAKVRDLIQEWNPEKWYVDIKVNIHFCAESQDSPEHSEYAEVIQSSMLKVDVCRQAQKDKLCSLPHT